ncbi:hypothetical protein SAMN05216559_3551 [Halomicrobium zhouii]|uniref:Uncharacterized protein n=1 Tax=Halomicrobium zhouii TaxID=767519 RepID=A0A1I6M1T9_9EURY|nr:hypothetical protein [Halomicrobium zhouii]SFS09633.1 hypothetical protein SAMN05216559_3551 [Halomicrobium zhouii]
MMRKGARFAATELLREPMKQAVREAIREEADSVSVASGESGSSSGTVDETDEDWHGQSSPQQDDSGGGRSKLATMGLVLAIVAITYMARKRMSSTSGSAWSEQSAGDVARDDAEGGYVSEGEMQTAETADESASSSASER